MDAQAVLIWTCVVIFISTAVVTFLALLGKITLGGDGRARHHYYLGRLFTVIIVEVSIASVLAFINMINENKATGLKQQMKELERSSGINLDSLSPSLQKIQPVTLFADGIEKDSSALLKDFLAVNAFTQSLQIVDTSFREEASKPKTLEISVYATSDEPKVDSKIIYIPQDLIYQRYEVVETTKNGKAGYEVKIIKDQTKIIGVKITANAQGKKLFGAGNWIGAILKVYVQ